MWFHDLFYAFSPLLVTNINCMATNFSQLRWRALMYVCLLCLYYYRTVILLTSTQYIYCVICGCVIYCIKKIKVISLALLTLLLILYIFCDFICKYYWQMHTQTLQTKSARVSALIVFADFFVFLLSRN